MEGTKKNWKIHSLVSFFKIFIWKIFIMFFFSATVVQHAKTFWAREPTQEITVN